ncbi:hypothetical protein JOD43_002134 [Pullulanibacillus pueri]|uniref:Uncharacterized protein n=1 Tax=Pullulanibacillus pueri TaxID=1437324 RepID=A0A8J2ZWG3_9BACL|nr:hypothetical protein [Pullulanibacillus pueri]MBM7681962.1 hypothetical protein [Pullulanibacillus pueri]GGH83602.1 hypothetical protein GCM10007096_24730 [Pullulanibacillus pueri]
MDYRVFYGEVADWIYESNQQAIKHGINSSEFWVWVAQTTGELCEKYGNNDLVEKQMEMLVDWLGDVLKSQK